jgi:NAD(P)-dependent dehydrogenase (short-subunit alcohol dehydrogenase family)
MVEKAVAVWPARRGFQQRGRQSPALETADVTVGEFNRVNAINLRGVWSCMKYELREMRTQGSGAIVNNSSIGGLIGLPGRAAYHASKHGNCCGRAVAVQSRRKLRDRACARGRRRLDGALTRRDASRAAKRGGRLAQRQPMELANLSLLNLSAFTDRWILVGWTGRRVGKPARMRSHPQWSSDLNR